MKISIMKLLVFVWCMMFSSLYASNISGFARSLKPTQQQQAKEQPPSAAEISYGALHYSIFRLRLLTIADHLVSSASISAAYSSGVLAIGSAPSRARCSRIAARAIDAAYLAAASSRRLLRASKKRQDFWYCECHVIAIGARHRVAAECRRGSQRYANRVDARPMSTKGFVSRRPREEWNVDESHTFGRVRRWSRVRQSRKNRP